MSVSSGTIETILHKHLGLRRVCSKLVPHLLSLEQKKHRFQFCHSMLLKYSKTYSRRHSEVITGDETWIYFYDMQTKHRDRNGSLKMRYQTQFPNNSWRSASECSQFSSPQEIFFEFVMLPSYPNILLLIISQKISLCKGVSLSDDFESTKPPWGLGRFQLKNKKV